MSASIRAGLAYFLIVFAIAFGIGAIRTGFIVPRIGALAAVCIEAPVVLAVSWAVCRRTTRRFAVPRGVGARLAMGATAFALLMAAELALSLTLGGLSAAQHWALYRGLPRQIGLAAQVAFAAIPLLQRRLLESR
jgi:hypothetical protein